MTNTPIFQRYVGIAYSGAGRDAVMAPEIVVRQADLDGPVRRVQSPEGQWSRQALSAWIASLINDHVGTIVAVDHGFSYPEHFLDWTHTRLGKPDAWADWTHVCKGVTSFENKHAFAQATKAYLSRKDAQLWRLTDKYAGTKTSTLDLETGPRGFAQSTYKGIRRLVGLETVPHIAVWPFDWVHPEDIPQARVVLSESSPSLLAPRVDLPARVEEGPDAHAYIMAAWMQGRDEEGLLSTYLAPPLSQQEQDRVAREGWILGAL